MPTVALPASRTVFVKTAKGHAEIAQRRHGLNPRQRHVLIVMDGSRSLETIAAMLPTAELEEIVCFLASEHFIVNAEDGARQQSAQQGQARESAPPQQGLIQDTETLRGVKDFMTITTQTYMGLLGADLIQRIERARDAGQLLAVVGHWHMALHASKQGGRFAQPYLEQVRKALGAA